VSARISSGHRIWAWADHIEDWRNEGLSVNAIRVKLAERSVRVGAEAIRAVLAVYPAAGEPSR
jgi:hypothetical protein